MFCLGIRVKTDFLLGAQFTPLCAYMNVTAPPKVVKKPWLIRQTFGGAL